MSRVAPTPEVPIHPSVLSQRCDSAYQKGHSCGIKSMHPNTVGRRAARSRSRIPRCELWRRRPQKWTVNVVFKRRKAKPLREPWRIDRVFTHPSKPRATSSTLRRTSAPLGRARALMCSTSYRSPRCARRDRQAERRAARTRGLALRREYRVQLQPSDAIQRRWSSSWSLSSCGRSRNRTTASLSPHA